MFKNCWACSIVTTCADGWFVRNTRPEVDEQGSVEVASEEGIWEQMHFKVWVVASDYSNLEDPQEASEVICMFMTDLINSWALLKVMKHLKSDRFRLLSGAVGCIKVKEVWTISVKTFVIEDSSFHLNKLLAKFCLHFVRCILTEYLQAWCLQIFSATSTLLQWASEWVASHCQWLSSVISCVSEEMRKFQLGWISASAPWQQTLSSTTQLSQPLLFNSLQLHELFYSLLIEHSLKERRCLL